MLEELNDPCMGKNLKLSGKVSMFRFWVTFLKFENGHLWREKKNWARAGKLVRVVLIKFVGRDGFRKASVILL